MLREKHFVRQAAVWIILIVGIMILSCEGAPPPSPVKPSMMEGEAPVFRLPDISGETFDLKAYRGKPVLLIFITTWCPTCRSEIPYFKQTYADYGRPGAGLEMVAVDIQESQDKVARFAAKYQIPYRTLLDERGAVAEAYGIRGVPSLVLIDREGKIICRQCHNLSVFLGPIFGKK